MMISEFLLRKVLVAQTSRRCELSLRRRARRRDIFINWLMDRSPMNDALNFEL
jgi:hypothetical protein